MSFLTDKIVLPLFIASLKTKRILKSAVRGKINYHAKAYAPFAVGLLVIGWALFIAST